MFEQNKLGEAKQSIVRLLKKTPNDTFLLENISRLLIHENNLIGAEPFLQKLVEIDNQPIYKQNLMILKFDIKKYEESCSIADAILSYDKKNSIAQLYKVKNCEELYTDLEKVEGTYQSMLAEGDNSELENNYGLFKNKHGHTEEAIKIFKAILEKVEDPRVYNNLAIAYMNQKEYDQAIVYFNKTIDSKVLIEDAFINLSYVYGLTNNQSKATEVIEHLLEKNPHSKIAAYQLAFLYSLQQKVQESNEILINLISRYKEDAKIKHLLGVNYLKQKQFDSFQKLYSYRTRDKKNLEICKIKVDDFKVNEIQSNKKIIIYSEQGIGDQIFHSRFINFLDQKDITLVAPKKMIQFYKEIYQHIEILESGSIDSKHNNPNCQEINLGTLIRLLNPDQIREARNITHSVKYNRDQSLKKIVGISWLSSGSEHGEFKSFDLRKLLKKIDYKNYIFQNLQYGDIIDEINKINDEFNIQIKLDPQLDITDNIQNLAKVISSCDVVVTCSNVTAHVAGLLGKETLLIVPKQYGRLWFWDSDINEKSFWYPSIQIIANNTWEESFQQINKLL